MSIGETTELSSNGDADDLSMRGAVAERGESSNILLGQMLNIDCSWNSMFNIPSTLDQTGETLLEKVSMCLI